MIVGVHFWRSEIGRVQGWQFHIPGATSNVTALLFLPLGSRIYHLIVLENLVASEIGVANRIEPSRLSYWLLPLVLFFDERQTFPLHAPVLGMNIGGVLQRILLELVTAQTLYHLGLSLTIEHHHSLARMLLRVIR